MSDTFDHEADAWDQALFHPDLDEDSGMMQDRGSWTSLRRAGSRMSYGSNGRPSHRDRDAIRRAARPPIGNPRMFDDDDMGDKPGQLTARKASGRSAGDATVTAIVKKLHRESDKAWNMSILIRLPENRVLECTHWMPKKACQYMKNNNTLFVPQWLVTRLEIEYEREIQYDVLGNLDPTWKHSPSTL